MKDSASVFVEVLAVLFIAGLLAVVAIPDFDRTEPDTQHKALITALEQVRTALDRYWGDHNATYPALEQLQSAVERPSTSFKPRSSLAAYLQRIPDNPFSSGNRVEPIETPVGACDWVYDASSGVFKANDGEQNRAL